jgi:GH24 family phage-related lysozyme (muramidase)
MSVGWNQENGKWYFYVNGVKAINAWAQDSAKKLWYYLGSDGVMSTGWILDKGKWYYLKADGSMATGWVQYKAKWYYLTTTGAMALGWLQDKNKWYYLDFNGDMVVACNKTINGKSYIFGADGAMTVAPATTYLVTDNLVNFVKAYEGFSATKYRDTGGVPTVGYGSVDGWIMDYDRVTEVQATQALKEEINSKAKQIKANLDNKGISLKQNEFDALCSFAYNCGMGALLGSTLYSRVVRGGRGTNLLVCFTAWAKVNGQVVQGLLNRRKEEYQMFTNGNYSRNL